MQVVGIVGPAEAEIEMVVEPLVAALADRGTVATIHRNHETSSTPDHATETHTLSDDGAWSATATDRDLDAVLDDLAPRVDYAVVEGFPEARIPTVALASEDHEGETLLSAPDATSVDVDSVVDAVETIDPFETLDSLIATVERSPDAEFAGAVATFTGRVRARDDKGDSRTEYLEFQRYDGVAEAKMADIRADLEAREGVYEVRLHHRTGVVPAGEDVVHVVVLAGHRAEAFAAVEDGIDRLKAEVPLFKKEVTVDGEFWAHQRE